MTTGSIYVPGQLGRELALWCSDPLSQPVSQEHGRPFTGRLFLYITGRRFLGCVSGSIRFSSVPTVIFAFSQKRERELLKSQAASIGQSSGILAPKQRKPPKSASRQLSCSPYLIVREWVR